MQIQGIENGNDNAQKRTLTSSIVSVKLHLMNAKVRQQSSFTESMIGQKKSLVGDLHQQSEAAMKPACDSRVVGSG